jgi:hypothetical protein
MILLGISEVPYYSLTIKVAVALLNNVTVLLPFFVKEPKIRCSDDEFDFAVKIYDTSRKEDHFQSFRSG